MPGTVLITGYTLANQIDEVPDEVLLGEEKNNKKIKQANRIISENTDDCEENKKSEWD